VYFVVPQFRLSCVPNKNFHASGHSKEYIGGHMNPKVDAFLKKEKQWPEESKRLRAILLGCGLTEELKWNKPCYTFQEANVVVIQGFKAYCALLFFKGVLMKDPDGILVKTGENTVVGRQIRFTNVREIERLASALKAYVHQAIELEKAGLKVNAPKDSALKLPAEFQRRLAENPALNAAFKTLTPGRQRAYGFYFSGAKQSQTRESRIEKCLPQILKGKGLNE
jgi:uncharacterized protein YdeI (YjbR/CyaY-like superfamily)